jgi:hypothetical protein
MRPNICCLLGREDLGKRLIFGIDPAHDRDCIQSAVYPTRDMIFLKVPSHRQCQYFENQAISLSDSVIIAISSDFGPDCISDATWKRVDALRLPVMVVLFVFGGDVSVRDKIKLRCRKLCGLVQNKTVRKVAILEEGIAYDPQTVYICTVKYQEGCDDFFNIFLRDVRPIVPERPPTYFLLSQSWHRLEPNSENGDKNFEIQLEMLGIEVELEIGLNILISTAHGMKSKTISRLSFRNEENEIIEVEKAAGTGIALISFEEGQHCTEYITTTHAFIEESSTLLVQEVNLHALRSYPRDPHGAVIITNCLGSLDAMITFCMCNGISISRILFSQHPTNEENLLSELTEGVIIAFGLSRRVQTQCEDVIVIQEFKDLRRLFKHCRNKLKLHEEKEENEIKQDEKTDQEDGSWLTSASEWQISPDHFSQPHAYSWEDVSHEDEKHSLNKVDELVASFLEPNETKSEVPRLTYVEKETPKFKSILVSSPSQMKIIEDHLLLTEGPTLLFGVLIQKGIPQLLQHVRVAKTGIEIGRITQMTDLGTIHDFKRRMIEIQNIGQLIVGVDFTIDDLLESFTK